MYTIEFFHDVLCAWCYAFSPRLRRLVDEFPQVEVIHRCFALAPTPNRIEQMFGSKEAGKAEILNHWRAANENDDEHRICTEDMVCKNFDYPYSMPGLLACKATEFQGGQKAHWDMFDRIQKAHLTETLNIADEDVLINCAKEVGLDIQRFINDFHADITLQAVEEDNLRARLAGVYAVPTIIINDERILSGAQKYHTLKDYVEKIV
ncbi:MAG: DsbA family protein [Ignavibacteriales bacterium]|nr:DsbA family protein [Ignavibacteriales bacterium]